MMSDDSTRVEHTKAEREDFAAEPQGPGRWWRNPSIIAVILGSVLTLIASVGGYSVKRAFDYSVDIAYKQGVMTERLARVEEKDVLAVQEVKNDTLAAAADIRTRAQRVRDDFDAFKAVTGSDLVAIKTDTAAIKQMLIDRLPPPASRHASANGEAPVGMWPEATR